MGVRLPAEYQEVEYLESTGTQFIDTGIDLNDQGYRSETVISWDRTDKRQLIGAENVGYWGINTDGFYEIYQVSIYGAEIGRFDSVIFDVAFSNGRSSRSLTVNNNVLFAGETSTTHPLGRIYVFQFPYSSESIVCYVKIKYQKLFVQNELIRYFIPCYRKADDKPGMYDLVSKTFYTNQGTGEFLVGPDVVNHISPRLMDRRRALIAKLTSLFRKVITSQTGLVSFDTNVAKPMKVTCEFSPKQDLHGYDNPWPAGGSVNLIPDGTDTSNGYVANKFLQEDGVYRDTTIGAYYISEYFPVIANTIYTWSNTLGTENLSAICFYDSNFNYIVGYKASGLASRTITTPSDAAYARSTQSYPTAANAKYQFEEGSTATAYAPYENICPIEGWDGANVEQRGNNLLDPSKLTAASALLIKWYYSDGFLLKKGITYSMQAEQGTVYIYNKTTGANIVNATQKIIYTPATDTLVYFQWYHSTPFDENTVKPRLVIGSASVPYEPYHAVTLPITFNNPGTYDFLPVQAGTGDPSPENVRPITPGLTLTRDDNTTLEVWGGSLTVNADGTGTIVSKYYYGIYDGVNKKVNSSYLNDTYVQAGDVYCVPDGLVGNAAHVLCNKLSPVNPYVSASICQLSYPPGGALYFVFRIRLVDGSGVTNASECISYVNGWLQENPTTVVYETKEASYQTYTLSVAETSRAFEALGLGKNLGPLYSGTVTINEDGSVDVVKSYGTTTITRAASYPYRSYHSATYTPSPAMADGDWLNGFSSYLKTTLGGLEHDYPSIMFGWSDNPNRIYLWRIGEVVAQNLGISVSEVTATQVNQYLAEHPLIVVYPLKTSANYHFSSISELQSFLGTNNVWSDLNGSITVEYYKKQQ